MIGKWRAILDHDSLAAYRLVFHEYLRAIGKPDSHYEVSNRLTWDVINAKAPKASRPIVPSGDYFTQLGQLYDNGEMPDPSDFKPDTLIQFSYVYSGLSGTLYSPPASDMTLLVSKIPGNGVFSAVTYASFFYDVGSSDAQGALSQAQAALKKFIAGTTGAAAGGPGTPLTPNFGYTYRLNPLGREENAMVFYRQQYNDSDYHSVTRWLFKRVALPNGAKIMVGKVEIKGNADEFGVNCDFNSEFATTRMFYAPLPFVSVGVAVNDGL